MGCTDVSEDSSETLFLLVENYNYDRSYGPQGSREFLEKNRLTFLIIWYP